MIPAKTTLSILLVCLTLSFVSSITHMTNLIWTVKEIADGVIEVKSIPYKPEEWVPNGTITNYGRIYYTDDYARRVSHRLALAFDYYNQTLLWTDRGFKNIYRLKLIVAPRIPFTYYIPLYYVYIGISIQVNAMAMDWLSGSVYWTDALYNWITVANALKYQYYNHLITTDLWDPQGIAVYPQKGKMFWSDVGAVCKIEWSRLDGTERTLFISTNLNRPGGMTIDYVNDRLYWVDDYLDVIEHVDIATGRNRVVIDLAAFEFVLPRLFGIALYKNDYIFFSEQSTRSIVVLNKTSETYIRQFNAAIFDNTSGIPYDIIMYDESVQEEIDSDCNRLGCSDICVSDGGQRAHCICREGYVLNTTDNATCYSGALFSKPQYIYAVGSKLCGTPVHIADSLVELAPSFVRCFFDMPTGHDVVAISFHVYAEFLFFSDDEDGVIHRMRVDTSAVVGTESTLQQIAANTGPVKGLAVDWIGDNLYWTDEEHGYIVVCRLDGRYPKILVDNLKTPKSINVNPLAGLMYWISEETIYMANMDGSNVRVFIVLPESQLDGMVVDIRLNRLLVVDDALPGIRTVTLDDRVMSTIHQSVNDTFQDVTVYWDYMAFTTGSNSLYFGLYNSTSAQLLRGIIHLFERTSRDIITYDEYLQPELNSSHEDPCDVDDDGVGCSQLCLIYPNYTRRCECSVGFRLDVDQRTCVSDRLNDNFLLFVDQFQKSMYQITLDDDDDDSGSSTRHIYGIDIPTSTNPIIAVFDMASRLLFWHDDDPPLSSTKFKALDDHSSRAKSLSVYKGGIDVGMMSAIPSLNKLIFTDTVSACLFVVDSNTTETNPTRLDAARNVSWNALAVDPYTAEIYWLEEQTSVNGSLVDETIYSCVLDDESCNSRSDARPVHRRRRRPSPDDESIVGLTVALDGYNSTTTYLVFWTRNEIYAVRQSSPGFATLIGTGHVTSNISKVVVVDDVIYFADWNLNSVYKMAADKSSSHRKRREASADIIPVTKPVFSRISDLRAYRFSETPPPVKGGSSISNAALGGIIGASAFVLLLILLLVCLLIVMLARRRKQKDKFVSQAHDNPTYMTHRELKQQISVTYSSSSPPVSPPVYAAYEADSCGVMFAYALDDDKYPIDEKKLPPGFDPDSHEYQPSVCPCGAVGGKKLDDDDEYGTGDAAVAAAAFYGGDRRRSSGVGYAYDNDAAIVDDDDVLRAIEKKMEEAGPPSYIAVDTDCQSPALEPQLALPPYNEDEATHL